MDPQIPKVNVVVLAYNHEQFIRQALDGILAQDVDFAYEVVVGEDCSTDHTRRIVQAYARRHPAIFRPVYHSSNVGVGANLRACVAACRGQYIALLDGDDYWTSPLKLRKQVAWLDGHPDYSLCFHAVMNHYEDGFLPDRVSQHYTKDVYTFEDFLASNSLLASTCSVLLRRSVLPVWPAWLFTVVNIDYPLVLLYADLGKVKLLPEVMGTYRIHRGGIFSGTPQLLNIERFVPVGEQLWRHFAPTHRAAQVQRKLYNLYLGMANAYANAGRPADAIGFIKKAVRLGAGPQHKSLPGLLKTGLRVVRGLARLNRPPAGMAPYRHVPVIPAVRPGA